jgi:hypothetical protein
LYDTGFVKSIRKRRFAMTLVGREERPDGRQSERAESPIDPEAALIAACVLAAAHADVRNMAYMQLSYSDRGV